MNRLSIVYSSRTGNTRSVAEYLAAQLKIPFFSVTDLNMAGTEKTAESVEWHLPEMACSEPSQLIIVGFWTWRGGADPAMKSYLSTLHGRRVFAFGTMAAWPDLKHIDQCRKSLLEVLKPGGNILEGTFFCQGRLDPKIRAGSRHPMTPERLCRLNEAEKHPNLADMQAAERAVRLVLTRLFHA